MHVGRQRAPILGMHALGDQDLAVALRDRDGHEDGLGHRAATVVKTGVGDVHARQLANQRLVFKEGLQAPLAGLGLVGRVGSVVFAASGDGVHDRRDEVIVTAAAEEADRVVCRLIARRQFLQVLRQLHFRQRRRHLQGTRHLQR